MDILEQMNSNPFSKVTQIARGSDVSRTTIARRLYENNVRCYTSARQELLSEDLRVIRYAYANYLLENYDQERFDKIIFSDEKTFQSDCQHKVLVYRPPSSRNKPQYVIHDRNSGRISASYWGAISVEGPATELVRIDGHFNQHKYVSVLRDHIVPLMKTYNDERVYMQDNSPVHTANMVMSFLSEQKFNVMDWCPRSPDLNPIENVWGLMTNDWPVLKNRTPLALDEIIQERWRNLRNRPGIIVYILYIYISMEYTIPIFQNRLFQKFI